MAKLTPQSVVADESRDGTGAAAGEGGRGTLRQAQGELRSGERRSGLSAVLSSEDSAKEEGLAKAQGQRAEAVTKPVADENSKLVRGNERSADVVAFEQAVVGFFVDAADLLGVPKSVAAIYGSCFASAEPLGFSEINERLEISSGSISQGLKVLRDVGALKVLDTPRSLVSGPWSLVQRAARQRERYEPDMELRKLVSHFIEERLERQLEAGKGRLDAIQAAIPATRNGSAGELKGRIKALQTWHNKGRAVLPVIKTFLKLT